jgi:hypothetical protein
MEEDFVPDVQETPAPKPSLRDRIKGLKSAPVQEEAPAAPSVPKDKPMSVGGFTENALDDAWDFAKGLFQIIPSAIKSIQQNVPELAKPRNLKFMAQNPGTFFNFDSGAGDKDQLIRGKFRGAIPDTLDAIKDSILKPYQDHGARVLYEKPFTVAADAITVITAGGTQLKNMGKIAEAAGAGEKAAKLIKAGEYLESLPSRASRGAVDNGVKALTGHDLGKEREFLHLKQEERGAEMLKLQDIAKDALPKIDAMNAEEKALFHKARVGGGTAYGVSEELLNQYPKVKTALEAYAPLEKYSSGVYRDRYLLSAEEAEGSLAKKYALENFGDVSSESIAKADQIIKDARATGVRPPMYGPHVWEKGKNPFNADDLLHDMMTGGKNVREGKIGALEALKGAQGYSKDPSVYTRQMVRTAADVEAKARMSERLMQEKGLITAPAGKAAEGMKAEAIPEGIHRKYYEDPIRAEALKNITDPTIKRLLKWEYTGNQNSMLRLYDKFFSVFAKMATRWNPKWVPGNIVGDAFLGALFDADWDAARAAIKTRQLPSQFLSGKVSYVAEDALKKPGIIEGALDRYGDIAGQIDQATRAGILIKSTADKLKRVAADSEAFGQSIGEVLSSTQKFSDVQVGLQRIEENVARRSVTVRARDKELAVLQQREKAISSKLEAMDLQKQLKNREAIEGGKGKIAEAWRQAAEDAPLHVYGSEIQEQRIKEATQGAIAKQGRIEGNAIYGASGQAGFEKGMRVLQDIRQKIVNKTAERNAIVRDIMDDAIKTGELERQVPGLRAQVNIVREGVDRANAVLPSYLNLNGFESKVMGRIIPFYPFVKTMTMLAFRVPFMAPVKSFMWNRLSSFLMQATNDPRLGEYVKGRIPTHVLEDGRTIWMKVTSYSPFEGLSTVRPGGIPLPNMLDPLRNPAVCLGFQFMGGKTVFNVGSLPYGEQAVSLGDGKVERLMSNGMLKQEIPATPLVSGVMHMFPVTQLIESVLSPSRMNKYNWAGIPEPVLNPDGSYKYPKELWERVGSALGVNLQTRSESEIARSDRIESVKAFQALKKAYIKGDADEKELIRNAFEDRARGEYRHRMR